MESNHLQIIGHSLCPYVQRVMILAKENKIKLTRRDIELHDKPNWFTAISPTGKVPLLLFVDKTVIFDSNAICEYLDGISLGSLFPKDLKESALCRAWLQFGTDILNDIAVIIYNARTSEDYKNSILKIKEKLEILEANHSGQKYFLGEKFYLVDAVFATVFRYFSIIKEPQGELYFFKDLPKIANLNQRLLQRESIIEAVPKEYNDLLITFIKKQDSYLSKTL